MYPVLIYDNLCSSCTEYARWVDKFTKGKLTILGHYTNAGKQLKKQIFPEDYEGLEMSWFVTNTNAYGGRKGLFRLLRYMLTAKKNPQMQPNTFDLNNCTTDCRTVKGVMIRSCSILTQGKILEINHHE